MKLPTLATRLLLSAAIAATTLPACAATPAPDAAPESQPQSTPETPTLSPHAAQVIDQAQQVKEKQRAIRDMQMNLEKQQRDLYEAARNLDSPNFYLAIDNSRPTLLITQPLDGRSMEEWTEDLKIMDKLLRNAIAHAGYDDLPTAMGIKLTTFGRVPPTYIEDYGILFSLGVNFPLAPSPNAAGKSAQPPEPESAWDRAKRDLDNHGPSPSPERRAPLSFDQSKVDNLLNAILNTLPQATNFRHLNEGEFVMITITGTDAARNPLRLTLKAKKVDINEAANKSITPDEFKKRVSWHIG